jgi:hypothetical protein
LKFIARDLTEYFNHPPALEEMQGKTEDRRHGPKGEVLIIVAAYHDRKRLSRLLDSLSKQNFRKFDIVIVYAKDDEFVYRRNLSILHVRRRIDLGFAGAMYLGQLLAYRDGYEYYMMTDVDKIPYSSDTLGLLYDTAKNDGAEYVRGAFAFDSVIYPSGRIVQQKHRVMSAPFQCLWAIIETRSLEKTGLYPAPLYLSFDDVEFDYRLKSTGIAERYLGNDIIFTTSASPMRLQTLFQPGERTDRTYYYPTLLSKYHMPEIFRPTQKGRNSDIRFILMHLQSIFVTVYLQRFLEQRAPGFGEYHKMARNCSFAELKLSGLENEITILNGKQNRELARQYAGSTGSVKERLRLYALAIMDKPVEHDGDNNFLISNISWIDKPDGSAGDLFCWKRKIWPPAKVSIMALSAGEALVLLLRGMLNSLTGRHLFKKYGLEQLHACRPSAKHFSAHRTGIRTA